ncbi:nucleolar transcription factor 1-B-like [Neltuma alba]|uniref:nucleolar transcription factor 1-B-like n=1 Tax=Neltuma alba TaxID=207710 RepID=UPI0010A328D1|nr:nucleolar transcription factor 1-B-like [Prosopis alba]
MVLEEGEGSTSKGVHSGLVLFKREYMAKRGEKCKNAREEKIEVGKAWRALSEEEKDRYNERARKTKPQKEEQRLRQKVQRMGFGNLLNVNVKQLPRDLLVSLLRCYDPPTHFLTIRGQGQAIEAKDAHEFLGVPDNTEEDIIWEESDNFEFLFMLYTVGAFLCPGSSTTVHIRLLKVMRHTMDGFGKYDWSTYIIKNLWKEMGDFVKMTKKKKKGTCNVGGCLYLLLLYFVERFPLGLSVDRGSTSAIEYWTEEKIKERVEKERGSSMGILHGSSGSEVYSAGHEDSPILQSLDPALKELRARFVKKLEESQRTLMKALDDELLKLQIGLNAKVKGMGNENATAKEGVETVGDAAGNDAEEADDVDRVVEEIAREVAAGSADEELDEDETSKGDDEKDEDEDEDEEQHDLHDREVSDDYMVEEVEEEGDRDGHGDDDKEVRDSDDEGEEATHVLTMTPTNVPLLLDREWVSSDSGEEGGPEKSIDLRRSTRAKSSTIKSPWIEFKAAPRTKRPKEERDIFFTLISRRPKGEEEGNM